RSGSCLRAAQAVSLQDRLRAIEAAHRQPQGNRRAQGRRRSASHRTRFDERYCELHESPPPVPALLNGALPPVIRAAIIPTGNMRTFTLTTLVVIATAVAALTMWAQTPSQN